MTTEEPPEERPEKHAERVPAIVGWGVTERCNLACPHCYTSATRSKTGSTSPADELTTQECLDLIDTLAGLGTRFLGWTGGEPLLREDLETLVARGTDHGIVSSITSNGTLLDSARAASLAQAGTQAIQISLDGSTPERNRAMRGASRRQFAAILEAIGACQSHGMGVHLAMIVSGHNLDDVEPFIELARRHGVRSVRFCGFVPWGHARKPRIMERLDLGPHLAQLAALIERVSSLEDPIVMLDPAMGPSPPAYMFHDCVAGEQLLYLDAKGSVYPCTSLIDDRFRVGNVREQSIEAIWNEPAMTAIARRPAERIHGHCASCELLERCHGGCRGVTHAHTGDLDASFPRCLRQASSDSA